MKRDIKSYTKKRFLSLLNQFSATVVQLEAAKKAGHAIKEDNCTREIDILKARIQELEGVLGCIK